MRVLLDTHVLIWALNTPARLSRSVRRTLEDVENDVLFSAASIWEVAIKTGRGRSGFAVPPDELAQEAREVGFREAPITAAVAGGVAVLPPHHRDPFDRLLVAQAMALPATLYTADAVLSQYSELVRMVV